MSPEEIQQIFFVECEESLAAAEAGLAACKAGTHNADTINAVFRAVHSIKGGAGAFGFTPLQHYTHIFETLLSDVREGAVPLTVALVNLMLRALDTLSDHVNAAREGGDPPEDSALLGEMAGAQASGACLIVAEPSAAPPAPAAIPVPTPAPTPADDIDEDYGVDLETMLAQMGGIDSGWKLHIRTHGSAMARDRDPLELLRELASLGGECRLADCTQVPPLDAFDGACGYLGWTFSLPSSVTEDAARDVFDCIRDDCDLAVGDQASIPPLRAPIPPAPGQIATPAAKAAAAAGAAAGGGGQSIRIDLAKLDRLIDSVGELVIAQAMVAQRLGSDGVGANEELTLLDNLTREIQESAMSIRAQPIGSVFSRVPRILRELSASTGKQVRLEVVGEATELDKAVIERLGEPLTHLIRNAVDHGIESAQDRIAAGKPPEGTLTLSAEHRSGRILIRISDDGRGIDRAMIFAKAVEKELVAPDAQLSREEIDNLIFAPGFSTAASVTNVSGRGVGMDVVRQNVKDLGGRILIESEEGKGTSFILTLPLTLAISDGMIVNVGDQTMVVPLTHVVESLRPRDGDVQGLGALNQMLNVRGRFLPVLSLADAIGAPSRLQSPGDGVLIVVDTEANGQAALLVDDICDQRQFVIKSLDAQYGTVDGVAGATILGDGRVALILDVDGLVATAMASGERLAA